MVIKLNKLKEIRTNRKYSYQYMAEKLNISKPFYWQIENNKRRLTYPVFLEKYKIVLTRILSCVILITSLSVHVHAAKATKAKNGGQKQ